MPNETPPRPGVAPVLVTGAAGFIGSHTVQQLLARGERVVGIDNFDPFYDRAAKQRNLEQSGLGKPGYEFFEVDICDQPSLARVFEQTKPAGVIHLAAKAGVRPSLKDPVAYARTNVLGTAAILAEAQRVGCSRMVMASSSSVYGNSPTAPFSETQDVRNPISPYAATKASCELITHTHWHLTKMPTACLRFFTVFGPRQRPDLAISLFLRKIAKGEMISLFGDGTSRDYTYIDDIVRGVLASYDRIDRFGYRIWNLGGSSPVALEEMVATIAKVVGKEPRIERGPIQPGDVQRTWADLTRSNAELDFKPRTSFAEGVQCQWEWLQPLMG